MRIKFIIIFSVILAMLLPLSMLSEAETRVGDLTAAKSLQYSFAAADNQVDDNPGHSLGAVIHPDPTGYWGVLVGTTWWENQRLGSMRRMIAWGQHYDTLLVHFHWMNGLNPDLTERVYFYRCWNAWNGSYTLVPVSVQPPYDEFAGYVVTDVTNDNRAVLGGHNDAGTPTFQSHFYWDFAPGYAFFVTDCRVPDGFGIDCEVIEGGDGFIWPAMCWQEGMDTVLHVLALENEHPNDFPAPGSNTEKALMYFRSVNPEQTPCAWSETYCVDTVYTFGHDCDCNDNGKVAIAWIANIPEPGDCDTCSSTGFVADPECNNDVYWQISPSGGVWWLPRENITNNRYGEDGYRPYTDLSVLLDNNEIAHVVWNARIWDADDPNPCDERGGRIFHYDEGSAYTSTVHRFEWQQKYCDGGAWNLNACKMTLSECDGKFYCLFVQYNDIPNGIDDDCAAGYFTGGANGELFLSVSDDGGISWDKARNLTNTYSPECDTDECESEIYPSMVKFGSDYLGFWPSEPEFTLDPSIPPDSPYIGDWYLHVQYINDHTAGCVVQNEGSWTEADVKWFRLPCVEPLPGAIIIIYPEFIFDYGIPPGIQHDTAVILENIGNVDISYSISVEEDTGPSGWLGYAGFSGFIPAGFNNTETGMVIINQGGIVQTNATLAGRLIIHSNTDSSPDTIEIEATVVVPGDCNWNPGDDHKMHFPQLPNDTGWDVNATYPLVLADDFRCMQTGYIQDIHFWGSWENGLEGQIDSFLLSFHADIPAAQNPEGFSKPGDSLWNRVITDYEMVAMTSQGQQGWFNPAESLYRVNDHEDYFQYNICLDSVDWFFQDSNTIYWLNISAFVDQPAVTTWGWKSSDTQWNDDGVWAIEPDHDWLELFDMSGVTYVPGDVNDDGFVSIADSAYLWNYMFMGGPAPPYFECGMYPAADPNGDCITNVVDIVYLVDYLRTGGPAPIFCPVCPPQFQLGESMDLAFVITGAPGEPPTCCVPPIRGNVDGDIDDQVNVADLTYLVEFLFKAGPPPPCEDDPGDYPEADINTSGSTNVADLTYLVDYLFKGGQPPDPC